MTLGTEADQVSKRVTPTLSLDALKNHAEAGGLYVFCIWPAFVIAVIASSIVNSWIVSTDEDAREAPRVIDTEAAVTAPGAS